MSVRRELLRMARLEGLLDALGDTLPLTHFSVDRHAVIDPEKAVESRRGARGTEQGLIAVGNYPPQTYWGVNVGKPGGYFPESRVGWNRHEILLPRDRFYDVTDGSFDRRVDEIFNYLAAHNEPRNGMRMSDVYMGRRAMNEVTAQILDEGYYGLYDPQRSIVTIGHPVVPEVVYGDPQSRWSLKPFDWVEYLMRR
jgi:hypothetical protein